MTDFHVTTNDASETKIVAEEPPAPAAQLPAEPAETPAPKGGKK